MTAGNSIEESSEQHRIWGNLMAAVAIFMMIACEALVIRKLWFGGAVNDHAVDQFSLPFMIALPALFAFLMRLKTRAWAARGEITAKLEFRAFYMMGALSIVFYACILDLALLVFRH